MCHVLHLHLLNIARLVVMITGGVGGDTFTVGVNHSLTCNASGGASMTYTYQWLRYDGDIVDETSSTVSFSPLREADVGRYNCRVSVGSLTITSESVVINVEGECNGDTFIINNVYTNLYLQHCHYQLSSHHLVIILRGRVIL